MRIRSRTVASVTAALALTAAAAGTARASAPAVTPHHVLLISVDGMHQSDLTQWIAEHPKSNFAALTRSGTTYANASTTQPSDSFPGLLSEVTGGTPKSTGVFYDVSYSRTLFAPGSNCTGSKGTMAAYDESIDVGASTAQRTILGETIDPTALPETIVQGKCVPVYPNDYLRTNSIFSVAHAAHLRTAWTDKHPAYALVNGHGTPTAVDDLFTPEINADLIPASLVDTRGTTITFPHPNPDGTGPFILTDYVGNTEAYDQIKVDSVLNQIDGRSSAGTPNVGEPAIFGMNFQTVSVGEKTVDPSKTCDPARNDGTPCDPTYVAGGYEPGTLTFTPQLEGAMAYVDSAIGSLVTELRARGEYASTEIVITAKHGQSPIDPAKLALVGSAEETVLAQAGIPVDQFTADDIALIWLKHQSDTHRAVVALRASITNGNPAHIATVLSGDALADQFGDPRTNDRTPDIIVEPIPGTIYSASHAKVAEHGGFTADDTHVALIVVHGGGEPGDTVNAHVATAQIAPTILQSLGLNPRALDAVRLEGTQTLPDLTN